MESKILQQSNKGKSFKNLIKQKLKENIQTMLNNLQEGMLLDISKIDSDIKNIKIVNPLSIPYEIIKSKKFPIVSDNMDSYLKFIDIMDEKDIFEQDEEYVILSHKTTM